MVETPAPVKPPPQVAGVVGIAATPVTMHAAPSVDWGVVAALPTFQMYATERFGRSGADSHEWARECAEREAMRAGDDVLFADYAAWHSAKGYWPNETPLGMLKEGV